MKKVALLLLTISLLLVFSSCDVSKKTSGEVDFSSLLELLDEFDHLPLTTTQTEIVEQYRSLIRQSSVSSADCSRAVTALKTLKNDIMSSQMIFIDSAFETCFRRQYSLSDSTIISVRMCYETETLDCSAKDCVVTTSYDLRYFPNLISLDLSNNNLSEINGLSYCYRLNDLNLENAQLITDATEAFPFSVLNNIPLKSLNLKGCILEDLTSMPYIPTLETLILDHTGLTTVSMIHDRFPDLTTLSLQDLNLDSLDGLSRLKKIKNLNLSHSRCGEDVIIHSIHSLENLYLDNVSLSDGLINDLPNLKMLSLSGCNVVNLAFLSGFSSLTTLNLSGNNLSVFPFEELPSSVHVLDLSNNHISNVKLYQINATLTDLNLSNNDIVSFESDVQSPLSHLLLSNNQLTRINLVPFSHLVECDLSGNLFSELSLNLPEITVLNVSNNPLRNLHLKAGSLNKLLADGCPDFTKAVSLEAPVLKTLSLAHTKLTDLSFILNCPTLNEITLDVEALKDYSAISQLAFIQVLNISNANSSIFDFLWNLRNLISLTFQYSSFTTPILHDFPKLTSLSFTSCSKLKDLSQISDLPLLEELTITHANCPTPNLSGFPMLSKLSIINSHVEDISDIKTLSSLKELILDENGLLELTVSGFPSLQKISLVNNEFSAVSALVIEMSGGEIILTGNPIIDTEDIAIGNNRIIY